MSIFNKKKSDKEKTYVTYSDGKFVDVENEFEDVDEEKEKQEFREHNKKVSKETFSFKNLDRSKILIITGISIILIPLVVIGSKVGLNNAEDLKDFFNSDGTTQEQIVSNDENQNSRPTNGNTTNTEENEIKIDKLNPKDLVDLNNKANRQITSLYNYLRADINLYVNGKESYYITAKTLKARREVAYKYYESFLKNEKIFNKSNLNNLFIQIRDRYANHVNIIDDILKDVTTKTATEVFNSALEVDEKLLLEQYKNLTVYLKEGKIEYMDTDNGIELK